MPCRDSAVLDKLESVASAEKLLRRECGSRLYYGVCVCVCVHASEWCETYYGMERPSASHGIGPFRSSLLVVKALQTFAQLDNVLTIGNGISKSLVVIMQGVVVSMLTKQIGSCHQAYQLIGAIRHDRDASNVIFQ